MSVYNFCPRCGTKTSLSEGHNFCVNCGYMLQKPSINVPHNPTNIDSAFDKLGLDSKTLKEYGLTKAKILDELRYGVKPKEEVIKGGHVEISQKGFE